jgi:ATP diphosphatase
MTRRHPHVFGDVSIADADAQTTAWEQHKEAERFEKARAAGQVPSVLDGVALSYPALLRSVKLSKRAARVGFDWPDAEPVIEKLNEEMLELAEELVRKSNGDDNQAEIESELGDILFAYTSLARHLNVDPEKALRGTNDRFEQRFRTIEKILAGEGKRPEDQSLDELEALWQTAKKQLRKQNQTSKGESE